MSLKYIKSTKGTSKCTTLYDQNNNLSFQTKTTIHTIYKNPRTNHLKASPIANYYRYPKTKIHITSINPQIPLVPNTNLASSIINKNIVTAITIPINTLVDQDLSNKHNSHHEHNQKNSIQILIRKLHRNGSIHDTNEKR